MDIVNFLCTKENGAVVCNPWLGQSKWFEPSLKHSRMCFDGKVYHNKKYKMVAYSFNPDRFWKVYDFCSNVWIDRPKSKTDDGYVSVETAVSLNGTLYYVCYTNETDPLGYNISKLDFFSRLLEFFCNIPCGRNHDGDALVLKVFREDQFSMLKQCIVTKKIDIWVTENNIENGNDVVWVNFMNFSCPSVPNLAVETIYYTQPSYFIEDKRLVVCSCDTYGHTYIYVFGDNWLISETRIDNVSWPLHCTFIPSLVPVPARDRR
ncbi:hypothetical protein CARUB_v10016447mg [Capsella rubella]|uniref:F-box associated beta-propeller type 1 domain-containing protein n=1 Tax=Capsella rubella TaxID=81985 RepID=R0HTG7_9BRAS|nr:hypothetical protein CARUB_v10016447mg [Capsella rubella]